MSKRPMYLQHVNIYVRNAERAKEWYEEMLGLHTYEYRPGWAAFMSADTEQSHEVALMQLGDDAPLQQKGQVGLNHMAWRLESLDDLKDFYRRIKAKGWPIEHISDHGISLGIYTRDPDGHGVEVFYEMPRAGFHQRHFIGALDGLVELAAGKVALGIENFRNRHVRPLAWYGARARTGAPTIDANARPGPANAAHRGNATIEKLPLGFLLIVAGARPL